MFDLFTQYKIHTSLHCQLISFEDRDIMFNYEDALLLTADLTVKY